MKSKTHEKAKYELIERAGMTNNFELATSLLIIAAGSFIMGAACVGLQLEKVKKQRDEALERLEEL